MAVARRTSRSFVLGFACGRSTWTCGFADGLIGSYEEGLSPAPASWLWSQVGAGTHQKGLSRSASGAMSQPKMGPDLVRVATPSWVLTERAHDGD
jgi:hypothetical protein